MESFIEKNLGKILISILVLIMSGIVMKTFAPHFCEKESDKVSSIGACDSYGYCGVVTESGKYVKVSYPVIGQKSSFCKIK